MNAVNISKPQFKANPYPFYAQLRAEQPVFQIQLPDGQTAWLITRNLRGIEQFLCQRLDTPTATTMLSLLLKMAHAARANLFGYEIVPEPLTNHFLRLHSGLYCMAGGARFGKNLIGDAKQTSVCFAVFFGFWRHCN